MTEAEARDWARRRVSRETLGRLERFAQLLARWQPRINLIAPSTVTQIWARHIVDSLQVLDLAPPGAVHWLDLGSGAGFPGLVCAMAAPSLRVTLVESDKRKSAFLREAARTTATDVTILTERIEDIPPQKADIVSARALAPLDPLLSLAHPHLAPHGCALFPKGRSHQDEISVVSRNWRMKLETIPSITDPEAVILRIGNVTRV